MPSNAASLVSRIRLAASSIERFSRDGCRLALRPYQLEVARAILDSVFNRRGLTFVVIFPRQSGKNELQAQLQAYLLAMLSHCDVELVSVSPTFRPQTLNAIDRLQRRLGANLLTRGAWHSRAGCTVHLGQARIHFFSGGRHANTVGATASVLLTIDEAQDVLKSVYDRKFAPMVSSTAATRVFWGTAWTSTTLLAREMRFAAHQQQLDGIRRLWVLTAEDVQASIPGYADFVAGEVRRLGRDHPFIKTQYFSEEIDAQLNMFNPARLGLLFTAPPPAGPPPASPSIHPDRSIVYAFLLDVAGQDERSASLPGSDTETGDSSEFSSSCNPARDSTALTIVSVDISQLAVLQAPVYRVVHRQQWVGVNHLAIFGQLKRLVESWHPQHLVIDATGVGEGLWAMLDRAFPGRVIPIKFTRQLKSEIGWRFLAIIETGRFHDDAPSDQVRLQYASCRSEVLPGPGRILRWGVPEGTRAPDGALVHDDFLLADSLVSRLDTLEWYSPSRSSFIPLSRFKEDSWGGPSGFD